MNNEEISKWKLEVIKWKLDRALDKLNTIFILTLILGISYFVCGLILVLSAVNRIEERIEKLQDSISVVSEPPQKTKAQLYLEKFGDHEFPPACDLLDE